MEISQVIRFPWELLRMVGRARQRLDGTVKESIGHLGQTPFSASHATEPCPNTLVPIPIKRAVKIRLSTPQSPVQQGTQTPIFRCGLQNAGTGSMSPCLHFWTLFTEARNPAMKAVKTGGRSWVARLGRFFWTYDIRSRWTEFFKTVGGDHVVPGTEAS